MEKTDTILIYQKPEMYFFPIYKDIVFPPYDRKEKTPLYYFYRCMNLLKIPASSFFWGSWKKHIVSAKKIIIFDYGYQNCMEKYIKKVNPDCKIYLFCWNKIDRYHNNNSKFTIKTNIYSTDKGDCEKYGLKYNHIFYPTQLHTGWNPETSEKIYFIGSDKGRGKTILALHNYFKKCGLESNIKLLSDNKDRNYRALLSEILYDKPLNYDKYLEEMKQNGILLDINQKNQRAITMRVLESVVFSKKLITSNSNVKNFSFFKNGNILLINLHKLPDRSELTAFVKKPFVPYTKEQLLEIDFNHWINGFH